MVRLLIAYNESLIVEGLKSMVQATALDLEILSPVFSGKDVLTAVDTLSPDIIILGPCFPDASGLELVHRLSQLDSHSPLIILIAEDESFDSIRKALRHHVFDYFIRSEITQKNINIVLNRAVDYLDHIKMKQPRMFPYSRKLIQIRSFFDSLLLSDDFPEDPEKVMNSLGLQFSFPFYRVGLLIPVSPMNVTSEDRDTMNLFIINLLQKNTGPELSCHAITGHGSSFIVFLGSVERIPHCQNNFTQHVRTVLHIIQDHFGTQYGVGVGSEVEKIHDIRSSYMGAQAAITYVTDAQRVVFYDEIAQDRSLSINIFMRQWTDAVDDEDEAKLEELIGYLDELLKRREFNLRTMIVTCTDLLYTCMGRLSGLSRSILSEFTDLTYPTLTIMRLKNADDIVNWFRMLKRHIIICFQEKGKDERKLIFVDAMKNYINEHWEEPLALQDIADIFHFSTSYVSRLFKQCNDCGFSDYVTGVKIEHSQSLLCEPDATVNSVAERLGYTDPYYFSKIFKKYMHLSPRDYMIRHQINNTLSGKDA